MPQHAPGNGTRYQALELQSPRGFQRKLTTLSFGVIGDLTEPLSRKLFGKGKTMHYKMIAMASAVLLAACATTGTDGAKQRAGQTLKISQEVWSNYQGYVKDGRGLGPKRSGAFAVVTVGDAGVAGFGTWFYCPRMYDGCRPSGGENPVQKVLDACRRESAECLIFARNEDIQVAYEIAE